MGHSPPPRDHVEAALHTPDALIHVMSDDERIQSKPQSGTSSPTDQISSHHEQRAIVQDSGAPTPGDGSAYCVVMPIEESPRMAPALDNFSAQQKALKITCQSNLNQPYIKHMRVSRLKKEKKREPRKGNMKDVQGSNKYKNESPLKWEKKHKLRTDQQNRKLQKGGGGSRRPLL